MKTGICVLGRGIERVRIADGDAWRPTRYIEQLSGDGQHTGQRITGLSPDDDGVFIAGANANVLAAAHLCEELTQHGTPAGLVILAAGRPRYLAHEPDTTLTEGRILAGKFLMKIRGERPEIVIFSHNRNTRDDIEEVVRLARDRRLDELSIITVEVHIPRATEFLKLCYPVEDRSAKPRIEFLASEGILERRYRRFSRRFADTLAYCRQSPAYRRTVERETNGIAALRAGSYTHANSA